MPSWQIHFVPRGQALRETASVSFQSNSARTETLQLCAMLGSFVQLKTQQAPLQRCAEFSEAVTSAVSKTSPCELVLRQLRLDSAHQFKHSLQIAFGPASTFCLSTRLLSEYW